MSGLEQAIVYPLLAILTWAVFSVGRRRVVRAQEFRVVDEHGSVRVTLGVASDGAATLTILDGDGGLGMSAMGTSEVVLADQGGKPRARLFVSPDVMDISEYQLKSAVGWRRA